MTSELRRPRDEAGVQQATPAVVGSVEMQSGEGSWVDQSFSLTERI
jgi:hypothetical protein